jgi:hypothetical protein
VVVQVRFIPPLTEDCDPLASLLSPPLTEDCDCRASRADEAGAGK